MQPNPIYPTMERRRTLAITAAGQQPASLLIAKDRSNVLKLFLLRTTRLNSRRNRV
jgi:hypothetical protein